MNFKIIGLNTAVAAATAVTALCISAPAHALGLAGSFLSVEGSGRLTNANGSVGSLSTLDFLESNIGEVGAFSDGGFAPFIGADVVLKDVMLKKTAGNQWELNLPSVAQFFTISGPGITYTLESFSLTRLASGNFEASFSGFFFDPRDNEQAEGLGDFTSQRRFGSTGTSLSLDVEAIPTPALLPGLVGFGIAALRKRKGEAVTATESEA